MPISPKERLHVVENQDMRYLVNQSDLHLDYIQIADVSIEYYKSIGPFRGTPFYKMEDLYEIEHFPPHSCVVLPDRSNNPYPKLLEIRTIKWKLGAGRDYIAGKDMAYLEVERMDADETLEETVIEGNLRYQRTKSYRSYATKPKEVEGEHVKHVFLYLRNRDLYLVNNTEVTAERLRYRRKHSPPKFPARVQREQPPATFEIRDIPAGSYLHLMEGFAPHIKPYSFNLKAVDWGDGQTYRGSYPLSITVLNYQSPDDSDLTSIGRNPELIKEEKQPDQ